MCNKAKVGYMSLITNSMQISLNNRHSPLEFMLGWYPFFILPVKCIKMWPCKICNEQFELHYLLLSSQSTQNCSNIDSFVAMGVVFKH